MVIANCLNMAFAEQVGALRLLEEYNANSERLRERIIRSEELVETRDSEYGTVIKEEEERTSWEFRTDGDRVDVIWTRTHSDEEVLPEDLVKQRVIWSKKQWLKCLYGQVEAEIKAVGFLSEREEEKESFVGLAYSASCLDGVFYGDRKPIGQILEEAQSIRLRSEVESIKGADCYVIDADTPYGGYTIWIDPEHGYNIARAQMHKSDNDIFNGKPMREHNPAMKHKEGGRREPIGKLKEVSFSLDNVEFEKIGDVWVPVEGDFEHRINYGDKRIMIIRTHHKRTHVDLAPDFEAVNAFVPELPDGTRVFVEGMEGIKYRWQDGKPVVDLDEVLIQEIDSMTDSLLAERAFPETPAVAAPAAKSSYKPQASAKTPPKASEVPTVAEAKPEQTRAGALFRLVWLMLAAAIITFGGYILISRCKSSAGSDAKV
jgi:hypothetical protein